MSSMAMKWAARQRLPDGTAKAVLKEIAWFAGDDGAAMPSQASIAERTGVSVRSVRTAFAILEVLGLIKRQKRSRGHAAGRLPDAVTLQMTREFDVTPATIRAVRASVSGTCKRKQLPAVKNLQAEAGASTSGSSFRGIVREQKIPIQEGSDSSTSQDVALERARRLAVIDGGRR